MDLIVHIGPHKTGSTAIQEALVINRERLTNCGYSYPEIGIAQFGHHVFVAKLDGRGSPTELADMFEQLNSQKGTLILSSENFSRLSPIGVRRLAEGLRFNNVIIVYYQRNLHELIASWWQELIKHGDRNHFLLFYAQTMTRPLQLHLLNVHGILSSWADQFGKNAIKIFNYDDINDTASHFFSTLTEFDGQPALPKYRVNKSFGPVDTEFMRVLNINSGRGLDIILNCKDIGGLRDTIAIQAKEYLKSIDVDYDCFIFKHLEGQIISNWATNIVGFTEGGHLFKTRSSKLPYVDQMFWADRPEFIRDGINLASNFRE